MNTAERDRNALHQLAFELGGTEGGEYWLDAESLDKVIDAALSAHKKSRRGSDERD